MCLISGIHSERYRREANGDYGGNHHDARGDNRD